MILIKNGNEKQFTENQVLNIICKMWNMIEILNILSVEVIFIHRWFGVFLNMAYIGKSTLKFMHSVGMLSQSSFIWYYFLTVSEFIFSL